MVRSILLALAIAGFTNAHFLLNWPSTAGFDDDAEATAPCGSFTPVINETNPEVQVGRFAVQITSTHPAANWSFYGTTSTSAPYNFTAIAPVITSSGLGDFCLDYLSAPSDFANKSGILQVIDHSVDGVLYQCAPVRWVAGSNSTLGPSCTNVTGFTASYGGSASSSNPSSSSPITTTSTAGAAIATGMGSVIGLGLMVAGLAL